MQKLSFKLLLEKLDQGIEDFSSQMEGGEETPVQKQQRTATNQQNVEKVWGNKITDRDMNKPDVAVSLRKLAKEWNTSSKSLNDVFNNIRVNGFNQQNYEMLKNLVGDVDNFMMDVQSNMPYVYMEFEDKGLDKVTNQIADQFQAKAPTTRVPQKFPQQNFANPNDAYEPTQQMNQPPQMVPPPAPKLNLANSLPPRQMDNQQMDAKTNPGINLRKRMK